MLDPNSTIHAVREVRVTMRGVRLSENGSPVQVTVRSDFIAPDLSAPATSAVELDKGLRGWSDYDVKVPAPVNGGVIVGKAERELEELTVGKTVIRTKAPATGRVINRTGPRPGRGKR